MELKPTVNRAMRVWWSILWRALLLGTPFVCFAYIALLFVSAAILPMLSADGTVSVRTSELVRIISGIIASLCAIGFSILNFYWLIGRNYGEFRLVLLSNLVAADHPSISPLPEPNQLPDPTSPSVTPPARAGGAPSVAADH
jgi:hypothetical protein